MRTPFLFFGAFLLALLLGVGGATAACPDASKNICIFEPNTVRATMSATDYNKYLISVGGKCTQYAADGTTCLSVSGGYNCDQVTDINHNQSIYIGNGNGSKSPANIFGGLRIKAGLNLVWTPIYHNGHCRYVRSHPGNSSDRFIPFCSGTEWDAVIHFVEGGSVNEEKAGVRLTRCAFPTTLSNAIGPTSMQRDKGDEGDQYHSVQLPFYPTGYNWPYPGSYPSTSTYTDSITDRCYKEYSVPDCKRTDWRTVTDYDNCWTVDDDPDCSWNFTWEKGWSYDCTPKSHKECGTKQESYCGDWGTKCEKEWHSWTETFAMNATAGDGEVNYPGWSASSWRTSGQRPDECNIRCSSTDHDCNCPGDAPRTTGVSSCSIPSEHSISPACVAYGNAAPSTVTGIAMAIIVANSEIDNLVSQGLCQEASDKMNTLNNSIDNCNSICDGWWAQLNAQ